MSKKRKVLTSTGVVEHKADIIYRCLKGYPEGLTPKLISSKTGINVNSVKSLIPKIKGIKKVLRGLYKVVEEGDGSSSHELDLEDWNFHNCILTATCDLRFVSPEVFDFGTGRLVVDVSVSGKLTARLSTDFPLNVSSLGFVGLFLREKFFVSDVMVSCVEFNYDYRNLRFDGVKSISVDGLVSQFKAYQKVRGLRVEHKTKVPLSVDTVVDMLKSSPDHVDFSVRLAEQRVLLERLSEATVKNTGVMYALIDRLNGGMKE